MRTTHRVVRATKWLLWLSSSTVLASHSWAASPLPNARLEPAIAAPKPAMLPPAVPHQVRWGDALKASEGCDATEFKRAVTRHSTPIRLCYRAALRRDPSIQGDFRYLLAVGGRGNIKATRVIPAKGGEFTPIRSEKAPLTRCLETAMKRLRLREVNVAKQCRVTGELSLQLTPPLVPASVAAANACNGAHATYVASFFKERFDACSRQDTYILSRASIALRYKPDGSVTKVVATSAERGRKALKCLRKVAKTMRFKPTLKGKACDAALDLDFRRQTISATVKPWSKGSKHR